MNARALFLIIINILVFVYLLRQKDDVLLYLNDVSKIDNSLLLTAIKMHPVLNSVGERDRESNDRVDGIGLVWSIICIEHMFLKAACLSGTLAQSMPQYGTPTKTTSQHENWFRQQFLYIVVNNSERIEQLDGWRRMNEQTMEKLLPSKSISIKLSK